MSVNLSITSIQALFQSRLATLSHLLKLAQSHFGDNESFLEKRVISDMLPCGTQIAFTCNQPRNFALWCEDRPPDNLEPRVTSLAQAFEYVEHTQNLLLGIRAEDQKLAEFCRISLGAGLYLELTGAAYVEDFLIPNFYFHLVTTYNILRKEGVGIGKRDYMLHLLPFVRTDS
ncbi:MAG: DUF1993 domain-containing protein [Pseudanabaenaceae cyanobacterium bins.68]|nr:DUF1993 domain-containing protein [Pseudanabaenaceae cyanobacterium bins.68]